MSINVVIISGNLTRDPEKRGSADMPILNFSVAVNDRRKVGDEWQNVPNYVGCVLFGARAKSLGDILRKGMQVTVAGSLRYSAWEKDGQKHSKLEVVCNEIVLPSKAGEAATASEPW